jgi:DNA-binding NarL/FixJ family response regulator
VVLRVLLIEKRALARAALRALLERAPGVEDVTDEVGLGDALPRVPSSDVVVLSGDGLRPSELEDALRAILEVVTPETRTVVVDTRPEESRAARAFRAGATAYLSVRCDLDDLYAAIRGPGSGERVLGACLSSRVVESIEAGALPRREPIETLTARQRQILRLVSRGKRTAEIAAELRLSPKTIEAHRSEIMHRLGVQNVAGLVHLAVREGIADGE